MGSKNKVIKDKGRSIRMRLLNISKENSFDYNIVLSRYMQERMLYRLSQSKYKSRFFLKGGALLYAYNRLGARPTLDVDFLIKNISNDKEHIKGVFLEILAIACDDDALTFDLNSIETEEIMEGKLYQGVHVSVNGFLDGMKLHLCADVGFGDITIPAPMELTYPKLLDDMPEPKINAYSLETVVAEKFQTMIALSVYNSRMKDFYDLYAILSTQELNQEGIKAAIIATFENRKTKYTENHQFFNEDFYKDSVRNKQWEDFLKKIKYKGKLSFEEVIKYIQTEMLPYWNAIKESKQE